jgi:flagellar basal-body rod protein FlgB
LAISFDKAIGIHADALRFRTARAEILANNLVNADTPGFKARDISFADMLQARSTGAGTGVSMTRTHAGHLQRSSASLPADIQLQYRNPSQPSVDGNTVDAEVEESAYMRNAVEFQASFTFLNGRFAGLMKALRGE